MKRLLFLLLASTLLTGSYAYGETLYIGGGTYIGEVVAGRPHGQGTWTHPDGESYVGELKAGRRHGQGTYIWANGEKYAGEWKDDQRYGQGTYTYASGAWKGDKYVGEFKNGKRHGQGTYTKSDGHKYVGEYKNGKRWKGIRYLASGEVAGTYSNGKWCGGCKPTARQLAIVRQIKSSQIAGTSSYSSTASSTSSNMGWCVTSTRYNNKYVHYVTKTGCAGMDGKVYGSKYLAEAEYKRREAVTAPALPPTTTLTLRSNVKDDRVYIDGDFKGSTQLALDLPKGQHTIRIEKDGYEPYEETVNLTDNLIIRGHLAKVVEQPAQTTAVQPTAVDNTAEIEFWKSIKDSDDPDMYRAYINQFPAGVYTALAKLKIKKLGGSSSITPSSIPDLAYGDYYALVIGNNDYQQLSPLRTAINDARAVSTLLEVEYGFNVKLLENATRVDIVKSISTLRSQVGNQDNLLIYYAGHGHLDEAANEGYWLPIDASRDDPSNWVTTDQIVGQIRGMQAKHVMVVADSCFSGTMTRAIKIEQRTPDYLQRIVKTKSRTVLTSGGLEPVMDSGSGNHSAFAHAFISLLEDNDGVLDAAQLFSELRPKVMVNSDQTPEYGDIRKAGHDGGDFLFVRR